MDQFLENCNLLLLLSCFSHVRLCSTPETAAHQAPLSLGFSRQEHWSGLSFPSPMHQSEKWKWSRSVVSDSSVTPWTVAYQAPPSIGFSRQEYWSGVPLPSPNKVSYVYLKISFSTTQKYTVTVVDWKTIAIHFVALPIIAQSISPSLEFRLDLFCRVGLLATWYKERLMMSLCIGPYSLAAFGTL